MQYIYLDESGQFTKDESMSYFVVASFLVSNPKLMVNAFRSWQRLKFPKKIKRDTEIKFSKFNLSSELKLKTLKFLLEKEIVIRYTYFDVKNIPVCYRGKKGLKEGNLYLDTVGENLKIYLNLLNTNITVICDKRSIKGIKNQEFIEKLQQKLEVNQNKHIAVNIQTVDSTTNANLQVAEWIVGAISAYLNNKSF